MRADGEDLLRYDGEVLLINHFICYLYGYALLLIFLELDGNISIRLLNFQGSLYMLQLLWHIRQV